MPAVASIERSDSRILKLTAKGWTIHRWTGFNRTIRLADTETADVRRHMLRHRCFNRTIRLADTETRHSDCSRRYHSRASIERSDSRTLKLQALHDAPRFGCASIERSDSRILKQDSAAGIMSPPISFNRTIRLADTETPRREVLRQPLRLLQSNDPTRGY